MYMYMVQMHVSKIKREIKHQHRNYRGLQRTYVHCRKKIEYSNNLDKNNLSIILNDFIFRGGNTKWEYQVHVN